MPKVPFIAIMLRISETVLHRMIFATLPSLSPPNMSPFCQAPPLLAIAQQQQHHHHHQQQQQQLYSTHYSAAKCNAADSLLDT